MIIAKIQGGLGNQLFQYAAGRSLALKNNTEFKLDISEYARTGYRALHLDRFNIRYDIASQKEIGRYKNRWKKLLNRLGPEGSRSIVTNLDYRFQPSFFNIKNDAYLDGHWQSEKYFSGIADIIRKEFTLKEPLGAALSELSAGIRKRKTVSVHIRRGDYISNPKFSGIYRQLGNDYYQEALKTVGQSVQNPSFLVFSDDPAWVRKNLTLPEDCAFASDYRLADFEELHLMSQCAHHIIANSTFGWWGAWLNNNRQKLIIGPKAWFNFSDDDQGIMPESWIKL